ncbi:hypothetical protein JOM56_001529 [Amanita muscaria]
MDISMHDEQDDSCLPSTVPSLNSLFLPPGPRAPSSLGSHQNSVPHSRPPSSFSRPSSSHSLHLHSTKPYAHSPRPTPSNARTLAFPFPLAQPRRSTPSSDQSPYSYSHSGLSQDNSEFMNPYTQSSTVAPHLNSYGATADSLSQQHGDLLRMGIEDLLWIPSVARLFLNYNNLKDQCLDLSSTITAVTKTQTKMYDDVALLRLQLEEARWQVPPPASGYYANMNCSKMSPNCLDHRAAAATRFGNSSERPEQFPVAILWTFADAKKDAAVGITLTNPNRPNLKQIIRTPGGSVVDDSIYLTLRSSAHNVAATLLSPLDTKRPELKGTMGRKLPGTKSFYKSYFKDQWMAALEHLEELQPLLALCAEHWKAEAVLQNWTRTAWTGGADLGAAIEKDTAGTMDPRAGADLTDNVDDNIKFNGPIDITFIKLNTLSGILAKRYPSYTAAIDLVKSLDLDSTVGRSIIAESVELFIRGVELADPRLQEYEEDDVGVSWGHYQLRGWREILPNWQAIGSPENARRLIAAVLKTCRVARALCHDLEMSERKIGSQTISYLSDNYLEQITEWLWELWKQAGGPLDKGKGKDLASTQLTSTSGSALSPSATQIETAAINREELAAALQSWDADKLKTLQKDELARVISAYKLSSSNVTRLTKPKLVETLLPALKSGPSEELVLQLPRVRPPLFSFIYLYFSLLFYLWTTTFPFEPYSLEAQPPPIIPIAIDRIYFLLSLSPLDYFPFSLGPLDS